MGLNFIKQADKIFALLVDKVIIPESISKLIVLREKARKEKQWELSDSLRDKIKEKGWIIEDTHDGYKCLPI